MFWPLVLDCFCESGHRNKQDDHMPNVSHSLCGPHLNNELSCQSPQTLDPIHFQDVKVP